MVQFGALCGWGKGLSQRRKGLEPGATIGDVTMTVETAQAIWLAVAVYLSIGVLLGLIALVGGYSRLDHSAAGSSIWFRLIALPGVIGLWPAVLIRLLSGRRINAPLHTDEEG